MAQSSSDLASHSLDYENEEIEVPQNQETSTVNLPSTTATKPRRTACLPCRHRKVRCNEGIPSCERCIRLGHECVYKGSNSGPHQGPQGFEDMKTRLGQLEMLVSQQLSSTSFPDILPVRTEGSDAHVKRVQGVDGTPDLPFEEDLFSSTAMSVDSTYSAPGDLLTGFSVAPWTQDPEPGLDFANPTYMTPSSILDPFNPVSVPTSHTEDGMHRHISLNADSAASPSLSGLLKSIWKEL